MKRKTLIPILALLISGYSLNAQVIRSEKAYLQVNTPEEKPDEVVDNKPPEITIISPVVTKGSKFTSDVPKVSLVGKVTDESGVGSVIINSRLNEVSDDGLFSTELTLNEGDNEVIIISVDKSNNYQEMKYIVEYSPPVVTFADKVNEESKYFGLIIGVNNYEDPSITNLDNPVPDARKVYDVLNSLYTFDKEHIYFLKDATRADIIRSLDKLADEMTSEDNLLIFYAGHGWWDQEANNGYWLPSDARRDNKTDWFRNSALVDYLKEIKSKHTLLIADACFGGAIFKTRTAFSDASKAIEMLYDLPSRKAMTSGTLTEVPDRSAFTTYLVERLSKNSEKYLSSEQLFSSFRIAVINNSDVVPQYGEIRNVGDQGGDFIFIKRDDQ